MNIEMTGEIIPPMDTSYLNDLLLDARGHLRPVYAEALRKIPPIHLRHWCAKNAIYQLLTWELIHWLKREIAGRRAIEICAGSGCLGRYLGIKMTDSFMQSRPDVAVYYAFFGQTANEPPADVERVDANDAIVLYKPEVVVGAWVSQKRFGEEAQANAFGPDEHHILDSGCTYIHVGNQGPHGKKRILIRPHRELVYPWLVSRASDPAGNRIWVWDK